MKDFLIDELGKDDGEKIYNLQQERLKKLVSEIKDKSEAQIKCLSTTILPRIALYQILCEDEKCSDRAINIIERYICESGAVPSHETYVKLQKVPCFYGIFKKGMIYTVANKGLWQSKLAPKEKGSFGIDITKCLWHDSCKEYGCPEICKFFCECDDIIYAGLRKMEFKRTKTLGRGGDCCDFRFYKK